MKINFMQYFGVRLKNKDNDVLGKTGRSGDAS